MVWRDPADQPWFPRGAVVAIGVFDGVHLGHRALLARARAVADDRHLPLVAVTFHPHPAAVLRPGREPAQLATIRHRIALLGESGVEAVHLLKFDEALSRTEPADWVERTLATLPAASIVVGEDFRFGRGASGDVGLLRELGGRFGFEVDSVGLVGDGERWSSSRIRAAIEAGDMATARTGLARYHRVEGVVVPGARRGRDLGYPTANIDPLAAGYGGPVALPGDGVYAGWLLVGVHRHDPQRLPAAVSVGTNPTFESGGRRRVEAFVLDAESGLDLYEAPVAVEFVAKLRDQVAYRDPADLVAQMGLDVARTREVLASG